MGKVKDQVQTAVCYIIIRSNDKVMVQQQPSKKFNAEVIKPISASYKNKNFTLEELEDQVKNITIQRYFTKFDAKLLSDRQSFKIKDIIFYAYYLDIKQISNFNFTGNFDLIKIDKIKNSETASLGKKKPAIVTKAFKMAVEFIAA